MAAESQMVDITGWQVFSFHLEKNNLILSQVNDYLSAAITILLACRDDLVASVAFVHCLATSRFVARCSVDRHSLATRAFNFEFLCKGNVPRKIKAQ